jgi:hypothetical protein
MLEHKITIAEASNVIMFYIERFNHDREAFCKLPPLFLHGSPGVGKSSIVRQNADKAGMKLVDLRLSQMDAVDLRGLPVIRDDETRWLMSSEFPKDGEGILLLDELNAAPKSVQVAAYQLVLDRKLGEYTVPDGWMIIAAGNLMEDRAAAGRISSALANRFLHLNIREDADAFRKYGIKKGMHPTVLGYINFKPESLLEMNESSECGFPTPRSWEKVSEILTQGASSWFSQALFFSLVSGLVGVGRAVEFIEYQKVEGLLPDIKLMLLHPETIDIPERADMKSCLVSSLTYILKRATENEFKEYLDGLFTLLLKLSSEFSALAVVEILQDEDMASKLPYIFEHPDWERWQKKHGKNFSNSAVA